ncbi:MAG TPA: hypothetical protein VEJ87_15345, partial [Acidimicrobiales bacterium]|nr:hypothetical protein [Acidimicrobiales bacterium]
MRILVVTQDFPWPPNFGGRIRLDVVVRTLSELGETDLFSLVPARLEDPYEVPSDIKINRVKTLKRRKPEHSLRSRLAWTFGGLPLEVSEERDPHAAALFREWAGAYDFVWVSRAATFEVLGRPHLAPTVVDLDDLEDWKILARIEAIDADKRTGGPVSRQSDREPSTSALREIASRARKVAARTQGRLNAERWRRFQRSIASEVEQIALASVIDRARLGAPNTTVVPNGYEVPTRPVGRRDVGDPPTLLFPGNFCYAPNSDAAQW